MDSMYAYIKGELAEKNIDSIVVEAAGVGYLIYIPTQYFDTVSYTHLTLPTNREV